MQERKGTVRVMDLKCAGRGQERSVPCPKLRFPHIRLSLRALEAKDRPAEVEFRPVFSTQCTAPKNKDPQVMD